MVAGAARKPRILVVDDSPSILRVVHSVLSAAGYSVEIEQEGANAVPVARRLAPDLILLDFMMPRMNGYQVCKQLNQDDELCDIPVVLMCTKGDGAAERFVQQMGIVDFITKPFSPEAILALTSYTLDKHARASIDVEFAAPEVEFPEEQTQVQPIFDFGDATSVSSPLLTASVEQPAATAEPDARALFNPLVTALVLRLKAKGVAAEEALVRIAVDEALAQVPPLEEMPSAARGRPALWGDLKLVPIPEVFQLMTLQGQTGLFQVWTDGIGGSQGVQARFDVYFSSGKVDFVHAMNVQEDFLLGRFLIARGAIDKTELDGLLRARKGGGKLLGQQLVALGHVTRDQLMTALRDQCSELVFELLRVQGGSFCMRKGEQPPGEMGEARLRIPVEELLLEGLRRVDEWGLIEKEITSFELRLEPDRASGVARLTDDERLILSLVAPELTVRQVLQRSGMRPFEVCKILYRLLMARQIRKLP